MDDFDRELEKDLGSGDGTGETMADLIEALKEASGVVHRDGYEIRYVGTYELKGETE